MWRQGVREDRNEKLINTKDVYINIKDKNIFFCPFFHYIIDLDIFFLLRAGVIWGATVQVQGEYRIYTFFYDIL